MKKMRLLLAFGNPYLFRETIAPLIPTLAQGFEIYILLVDFHTPKSTIDQLKSWESEGRIMGYELVPNFTNSVKLFFFLKRMLPRLRSRHFDVLLTSDEVHTWTRCLSECVLPDQCVRLCFQSALSYLLRNAAIEQSFSGVDVSECLPEGVKEKHKMSLVGRGSLVSRVSDQVHRFIRKAWRWVTVRGKKDSRPSLRRLASLYTDYIVNRIVVPWLIVHKTFPLGPYDSMTHIGSGRSDAYIFCDEVEAKVYAAIVKTPHIHVAQHPAYGQCRCQGLQNSRSRILAPLSGVSGAQEISERQLFLFYRDLRCVLVETCAQAVHLRIHPREKGSWHYQLKGYLRDRGIDVSLVDAEQPLREIVCDYVGVVGALSGALRDARASCNYAFIVGFVAVSKAYYCNPKFVYGKSEGVGWIEEDGSYDAEIFCRYEYIPPSRKSVNDILRDSVREKFGKAFTPF